MGEKEAKLEKGGKINKREVFGEQKYENNNFVINNLEA